MPPSPEDRVRQLAKQNTTCPNCHQTKKFGFGTICIKFHTFVCNECKTSHQAVSHRCKSITMSSWTHAEVDELEQKGNAFCEATWLAKAPPVGQGGRPTAGSSIDVFKRFVVDAYEHKRYYSEQPVSVPASSHASTYTQPQVQQQSSSLNHLPAPRKTSLPSTTAPSTIAAPQPVADFLDFASFDAAPVVSNTPAAAPAQSFLPTQTPDPFAPAPSFHNTNNNKNSSSASYDPFADFTAASTQTDTTASSSFAAVNANPTTTNATANKKPIMNTGSTNVISNMPMMTQNNNMNNSYKQSQTMSSGMYPTNGMMMQGNMQTNNGMMPQMNNTMGGMYHNIHSTGSMYNKNNSTMMGGGPVMSYHGGSTAISNMGNSMQQKQQKQKDAFSDLLPF